MRSSFFCAVALSVGLTGCAATEYISRNAAVADVHVYSRNEEAASNLIDRALGSCPDETEAAATACVRDALSATTMGVRAVASSIPGCTIGSVCTYEHTTQRRLGLIPMYATVVRKDWVVTIDLRQSRADFALLPITVRDRNVFVVAPVKAAPAALAPVLRSDAR